MVLISDSIDLTLGETDLWWEKKKKISKMIKPQMTHFQMCRDAY